MTTIKDYQNYFTQSAGKLSIKNASGEVKNFDVKKPGLATVQWIFGSIFGRGTIRCKGQNSVVYISKKQFNQWRKEQVEKDQSLGRLKMVEFLSRCQKPTVAAIQRDVDDTRNVMVENIRRVMANMDSAPHLDLSSTHDATKGKNKRK